MKPSDAHTCVPSPTKTTLQSSEPLARRQVLADRAQVADLLRGVVIVAHAVDDRDRARLGKLHDRAVLDDARHDHIDQPREHPARVADGLMTAELDHARPEVLRVTAELAHGRLERHARAGARLLEDHAEVLVFHQRGIIPLRDGALDGQRQLNDVQQLLPGEVVGVDKVLFVHIHSSKGASSGFASRLLSAKPRADMRRGAKILRRKARSRWTSAGRSSSAPFGSCFGGRPLLPCRLTVAQLFLLHGFHDHPFEFRRVSFIWYALWHGKAPHF